jgi:hypothetical protein
MAPEMRATVMIAKVDPKAAAARTAPALASPPNAALAASFSAKSENGLPSTSGIQSLLVPSTKAMLAPKSIQRTPTRPIVPKLSIIMDTTLLALTRPP